MTGPYSVTETKEKWAGFFCPVAHESGSIRCFAFGESATRAREVAEEIRDALNRDHALRTRRVQDPCLVDGQRDHGVGLRITEVADV